MKPLLQDDQSSCCPRPAGRTSSPQPSLACLLHQKLLAGPSATAVLREVFGDPVVIRRLTAPDAITTQSLCDRLEAHPTAVMHRRVELLAADRAVSRADLWYVPARLFTGMAESLLHTDLPFGAVVAPMRLSRDVTRARFFAPGGEFGLEHEAILRDAGGHPIALVQECYLSSPLRA